VWYIYIVCVMSLVIVVSSLQMEHLKACSEIATQRTINWQKFCMKDDCMFII